MTGTTKRRRMLPAGAGTALTAAVALSGLAGAVVLTALAYPLAGFSLLTIVTLGGLSVLTLQVRATRRTADKVSSDLDAVASHLVKLEHRLAQARTGADPSLRSEVAEVSGEIGLLGGLLRDLAETVAAQDRDVADLKQRLAPKTKAEPRPVLVARTEAAPSPPSAAPIHPEPSLLPGARRDTGPTDTEARRMAAIVQAFESDRLEIHLQPVVSLPQRKVKLYEALARLRLADETILVPAEFMPLLERLGHSAELDRRVISRAVLVARHLVGRGSEAIVSVNLSPRSLDEAGFLRSIGRILEASPDTLGKVVLELSQRCWRTLDAEKAGSLALLRDKGIPFALDRATDLRLDPLSLADRGVRFVKLPGDLLVAPAPTGSLDIEIADLGSVLRRAGIKLVAEKVEREEVVPDLIDLDVPLAQGFVFAAPRSVRPDVLPPASASTEAPAAAAPEEPAPAPEPDPPPPPPPERRPFRAFLRRA